MGEEPNEPAASTSSRAASSPATSGTSPPGSPPTGATATRSSRAATGWWSAGPARGPTARSSCAGCSAWRTPCRWGSPARPTTSAAGPSTSTRAAATRCSASSASQEAYFARFPGYERGITVPAIVDVPTGQVVTNDFAQITLDLSTRVAGVPPRRARPTSTRSTLRDEIDEVNAVVFPDVNNGVYRCGFAGSQEAYEQGLPPAVRPAGLADRAADRPALPGRRHHHRGRRPAVHHAGPLRRGLPRPLQVQPAEADARCRCCGPTPGTCSRRPGFGDTIDFDHIKRHYYVVHRDINPTGIVPLGPDLSNWLTPHGREQLGGRPFGDGTPPPPPAPSR